MFSYWNYGIIILIVLVLIWINTSRWLHIRLMFQLYNISALWGLRWQLEPHLCSQMIEGFEPVMPAEYYAEFNRAIYPRNSQGDNTINQKDIKRICDRNLRWLQQNAKPCVKPNKVPVIHIKDKDSHHKIQDLVAKGVPFLIRGVSLDCQTRMKYKALMEKAGENKVYMSISNQSTCPKNTLCIFFNISACSYFHISTFFQVL